jgi:large subunit ribosomal protein L33
MAKSQKDNKIFLFSEEGTGCFYATRKNARKNPEKLRKKKYDKVLRRHVMFVEKKMR